MKNKKLIYWIWIIAMSYLFYNQYWGLNTLIFTVFSLIIFIPEKIEELKQQHQKLYQSPFLFISALWLLSAFSVFMNGGIVQGILFFIVSVTFLASRKESQFAFFYNWLQIIISGVLGWYYYFTDSIETINDQYSNRKLKLIKITTLSITGILILISFFKIYQAADENFYQMTAFINLSWIDWGFIFVTIFLSWFFYGTYFLRFSKDIADFQSGFDNKISTDYNDRLQTFLNINYERVFANVVMLVLIILLSTYLVIDILYLQHNFGVLKSGILYSDAIHSGVGAVVFSIVLVIGVITFFFRGQLNFMQKNNTKKLATIWLLLNVILIITTALKNFDYVQQLGLTYLRLGVFLYLVLCVVGIVFCLFKIHYNNSFWYLMRRTSIAFLTVFVIACSFNWNKIIVNYNLYSAQNNNPDLYYLYYLGPETYAPLLTYLNNAAIKDENLFNLLVSDVKNFQANHWFVAESWRSFTYRDYYLHKEMNKFNFVNEKVDYTRSYINARGL